MQCAALDDNRHATKWARTLCSAIHTRADDGMIRNEDQIESRESRLTSMPLCEAHSPTCSATIAFFPCRFSRTQFRFIYFFSFVSIFCRRCGCFFAICLLPTLLLEAVVDGSVQHSSLLSSRIRSALDTGFCFPHRINAWCMCGVHTDQMRDPHVRTRSPLNPKCCARASRHKNYCITDMRLSHFSRICLALSHAHTLSLVSNNNYFDCIGSFSFRSSYILLFIWFSRNYRFKAQKHLAQ